MISDKKANAAIHSSCILCQQKLNIIGGSKIVNKIDANCITKGFKRVHIQSCIQKLEIGNIL